MDYGRTSNDWTIPGSPRGAWVGISLHENIDHADDRLVLAVWPDDRVDEPAERFEVFRDAPGWSQLRQGMYGSQQDMAAAYGWWSEQRDTVAVRGYQVLAAVWGQYKCTDEKLAAELLVPVAEVERGGRYGGITEALCELRLLGVHPTEGWYDVTRQADPVLQPAGGGPDASWFGPALETKLAQQGRPAGAAVPAGPARAFPGPLRAALGKAAEMGVMPTPAESPTASRAPRGR